MAYNIELNNTEYLNSINANSFEDIALSVFRHQYLNNELYRNFTNALHVSPETVTTLQQIPFLPISFFKTHRVMSGDFKQPEHIFESSGTTGDIPSRHYVVDGSIYEKSLLRGFENVYGNPEHYVIIALLPSYLERKNASLVHMAKLLMEYSGHPDCGFYLNEWDKLKEVLLANEANGQKVLLIGVTFALLDFADAFKMQLNHTIVMETGGMKGRREEWTRDKVHDRMKKRWGLKQVHSEYGMTELLSQAYAKENGIFTPSKTMQVLIRDMNDPLELTTTGTGCLNIIDLANIHSCAFIATEDVGRVFPGGTFEVLGRLDHAALRGCSLMVI